MTAAVRQNRFAANLGTATGSGADEATASAIISGQPPPEPPGAVDIGAAFAGAISTALLVCAVVAALAAIVGMRWPHAENPFSTEEAAPDRGTQHRVAKEG